jgi:hypothetical protein
MEYFQIAEMFGKRRRPLLDLYLEATGIASDGISRYRELVIGIENRGRGAAKFPAIRFQMQNRVSLDNFGIDGNGGFGLPQHPAEPGYIMFGGGVDHVICPESVVKIAKLKQQPTPTGWVSPNRGAELIFEPYSLTAVISADDVSSSTSTKTIPADQCL